MEKTNLPKSKLAPSAQRLLDRIESREAVVGIVGLGYVGLPLALCFAEQGFTVIGFDTDAAKVEMLGRGESYIQHIGAKRVAAAAASKRLLATGDFSQASKVDAIILCVPTPLGKHMEPDVSYIVKTMESLEPHLAEGQLLSLESTTYPGTTEDLLKPIIEGRGFTIGKNYFLTFSPEREDPGNKNYSTSTIPKLVGGVTEAGTEVAVALYRTVIGNVVPVGSPQVAEMAKLFENTFRSVNIGLVNELKIVCDKLGIDVWEVIDAAATKPFGFMPFYPGPGLGGHCIPIDPFYLTWKAKEVGIHTHFIELAGEINSRMPEYVCEKVGDALNEAGVAVSRARILILGVAYKRDIDDLRESPALEIMEILGKRGATLEYSDPHIPRIPKTRRHNLPYRSIKLSPEKLHSYDCVVLVTDHSDFDYEMIRRYSAMIVDTRGKFRDRDCNVIAA